MKSFHFAIALVAALPCAIFAAGGGGGGSGGGGAGGSAGGTSSTGAASGPSSGTNAAGTPNAGAAGAVTAATSGVPSGPANPAGLNNSGNDPSGALNADKSPNPPGTVGLAPSTAPPQVPQGGGTGDRDATGNAPAGTNALGTAQSSGGSAALRQNGTTMPGPNKPTRTQDQDSDRKIDEENQKLDRAVNNICRGC